jgi:hypothetical protein
VEQSGPKWPLRASNRYVLLCSERYLTRTFLNIRLPTPPPFLCGCLRLPRTLSRTPFTDPTAKAGSCGLIKVVSWFCGVLLLTTRIPIHRSQFWELWPTKKSTSSPNNLLWYRANGTWINEANPVNGTPTCFFSGFHDWAKVAILRIFFSEVVTFSMPAFVCSF